MVMFEKLDRNCIDVLQIGFYERSISAQCYPIELHQVSFMVVHVLPLGIPGSTVVGLIHNTEIPLSFLLAAVVLLHNQPPMVKKWVTCNTQLFWQSFHGHSLDTLASMSTIQDP